MDKNKGKTDICYWGTIVPHWYLKNESMYKE